MGRAAADGQGHRSDIHALTGRYPAIVGLAMMEEPMERSKSDQENAQLMGAEIAKIDAVGGIAAISAHWDNPMPGPNGANDFSQVNLKRLLPGGDLNGTLNRWLDTVALMAQHAVRADGSRIPFIFRPLHEGNGNWAWWYYERGGAETYRELFRYIVKYVRDHGAAEQMLVAFAPNGNFNGDPQRYQLLYPGDDVIDILGYDGYDANPAKLAKEGWVQETVTDLAMLVRLAEARGKVAALTEFGRNGAKTIKAQGNSDREFYTDLLQAILADPSARKIAYLMTWANWNDGEIYVPRPGEDMAENFKAFARQLQLTQVADRDISVNVAVEHGSTADDDLSLSTTALTITKGETGATFTVAARADGLVEGDEHYAVRLLNPQGASINAGQERVTTTIHDGAAPSLSPRPSVSASPTASAAPSVSVNPPITNTPSAPPYVNPTLMPGPTAAPNPTTAPRPTVTPSPSASLKPTNSPAPSASPTGTATPTAAPSPSAPAAPTPTVSPSPTASVSPSLTAPPRPTVTNRPSAPPSAAPSPSVTNSPSARPYVNPSATPSPVSNHRPSAITLNAGDTNSYWVRAESAGAAVGRLTVSDADKDDRHRLQVSDGRFEITGDGLLKLKDGQSVHYSEEQRILLTITATDSQGADYSQDIAVQVKDEGSKGTASDLPVAPGHDPAQGVRVPPPPTIARDPNQRGAITIAPAAGADLMHLRYRDEGGRSHAIDLVKHNGRWHSSDGSLNLNPQSGLISLKPEQLQDGGTVSASNASRGIYADQVAQLTADSDGGRIAVPTLAQDGRGGIYASPAADQDGLHLSYTDGNDGAQTLDAIKENGRWHFTNPASNAAIDPASGTINLAAASIKPGSAVYANGGQNGRRGAEVSLMADGGPLEAHLFAAGDLTVNEGERAHYLIRLNRPAAQGLSFTVQISHRDTDDGDLNAAPQTVFIPAGARSATFHLDTYNDQQREATETYKVSIAGPGVPDWKASLTGEIRDNDGPAAPVIQSGGANTTVSPAGGATHIVISYPDRQFGQVTLNAWQGSDKRWRLSELNPDKRSGGPTIDPASGTVSLPATVISAGGTVRAHNNDGQASGRNGAVADYVGWQRDWQDDFSKPVEEGGWTRYGWAWQAPEHGGMGRYQQSNVYSADGVLHVQNQYHGGAWTSGGISSGDNFATGGGRWEVRARFPDAKGFGYVFLLWPKSERWPPEVDFAEGRARDPSIMGTYHWGSASDHKQNNQFLRQPDLTDWHTYGAIIDPDAGTISYTFDGQPWYTLKNVPVSNEIMWLGIQTGAQDPNGSTARSESIDDARPGALTPAVASMQIDWVAHYRRAAVAGVAVSASKDADGKTTVKNVALNGEDTNGGSAPLHVNHGAMSAEAANKAVENAKGLRVDLTARYYGSDELQRLVDAVKAQGGQYLQLRLSSDDSYALESELLGQSTANSQRNADGSYTNSLGQQFYGRDQLGALANYAKRQDVELIAEVDFPGQARAVYQLLKAKNPEQAAQLFQRNGQPHDVAAAGEFVRSIYGEVINVLPNGKHFHMGGGEFAGQKENNGAFLKFVSENGQFLKGRGLQPQLWNDGVYRDNLQSLDKTVEVEVRSAGDGRASVSELKESGFKVRDFDRSQLHIKDATDLKP